MTPDPEPGVIFNKPDFSEQNLQRKRKQARKKKKIKNLSTGKKHTHTQIKIIFGTYVALLKFFKRFINTS